MTDLREDLQAALGGAYTLEHELGGGGMSRVFVAADTTLGRKVAVKVLPPEMSAGVSIERFKREIMLAARLQHPHIVPVLSAGGSGGMSYFTMPFVEGESLRARLAQQGELPVQEAVRVLREIASALAYAHERGVVHRDVKPDNVLLSGGAAMVTDFGVAKALSASSSAEHSGLTSLGIALGTPAYMSPEQASADPAIDQRADIYAFGALAYEVLTGQPPFAGRNAQALLAAQIAESPESITRRRAMIPPALAALVMRCLEKRPADRPQSAAEIVHVLDTLGTPTMGMPPGESPSRTRRWLTPQVAAGLGALAIVVAALGAWSLWGRNGHRAPDVSTKSIAVLPFENASGDTSMAFFADGMADELATALSQAGIRVAARGSVATVQAKHANDEEAGRLLGVQMLLHGSVRRAGRRIRVFTQLVNANDHIAVWTKSYDTTLTDVFHVQDDLARAIASELRPSVGAASIATSSQLARGTSDVEAYDLFMKGRYYIDRFQSERAIELLNEAVKRDPNFARGYATLARAYESMAFSGVGSTDSIRQLQQQAADRAIRIDSTFAQGYGAVGIARFGAWQFAEAETAFKRAIALQPDDPDLHFEYSGFLMNVGRPSEAAAQAQRVTELDPLSVGAIVLKQYSLVMLGRLQEADVETRRGLELDSTFVALYQNAGLAQAFGGHPDSALALWKRGYDLDPKLFGNAAYLLFGYAATGRWADVDRVQAQIERDGGGNSPGFFHAVIAIVNGDRDRAIAFVERGFERREPLFAFVPPPCDPMFGFLRDDPRFVALMQRYGFQVCPVFAKWPIRPRPK